MIEAIQNVLREVGEKLLDMRVHESVTGKWEKSQLKSNADIIAERLILNCLRNLTPNIPIISEESKKSHNFDRTGKYWLIDPLDGTASFFEGYPGFVSQVALMKGAVPIMSAVYAPVSNHMYIAKRNFGSWRNDKKLKVSSDLGKPVLIDNYPKPRGIANKIVTELPCSDYIECGSIGLKICKVAENSAHLFVKNVTVRDWDVAPGELILSEAGGCLHDFNSNPFLYEGKIEKDDGLVASCSRKLGANVCNFMLKGSQIER